MILNGYDTYGEPSVIKKHGTRALVSISAYFFCSYFLSQQCKTAVVGAVPSFMDFPWTDR